MSKATTQLPLSTSYTELVIEKSNLLLRANMLEAEHQFDDAAEFFASAARIEARLASIAEECGQDDKVLIHLVSEMSCWAAAGDTYRALSQAEKVLSVPNISSAQTSHVTDFINKLNQRRRLWMASWEHHAAAA